MWQEGRQRGRLPTDIRKGSTSSARGRCRHRSEGFPGPISALVSLPHWTLTDLVKAERNGGLLLLCLMNLVAATACTLGRAEQQPYLSTVNVDSLASSCSFSSLWACRNQSALRSPWRSLNPSAPPQKAWHPGLSPSNRQTAQPHKKGSQKRWAYKLKVPHHWYKGRRSRKQTEVEPETRKWRVRAGLRKPQSKTSPPPPCHKQVQTQPGLLPARGPSDPTQHCSGPRISGL